MKELLLLLFFGKTMLLTPVPVTIGPACININADKPLRAINSGAVLSIQILPGSNGTPKPVNTAAAPQQIEKIYPLGSVTAVLYRTDGSKVNAINTDVATGNNFYGLDLYPLVPPNAPKATIPSFQKGDKFSRVTICSKAPITDVKIYWRTAME